MSFLPEVPDGELEYGWRPKTQIEIPPEMVVSMAQGMVDPEEIAAKHGFTGEKWEKLQAWKPFLDAVKSQRDELEGAGYSFRIKAKWKAEDLADDYYLKAKSPEATFSQVQQAVTFFTRIAGLEPKEEKLATQGEGFSVTINMNTAGTGVDTVIGGQTSARGTLAMVEDVTPPSGYRIAPLVDPTLFAEMAANTESD